MKKFIKLFTFGIFLTPLIIGGANAAQCSKISLVKCLDSACAINLGANPAARCQLCGTSGAGTEKTNLTQLSLGLSAKTSITADELKNAPTDAGKRYAWATGLCLEKLPDCTTNDATTEYDKLIEQSCRAAGINMQMGQAQNAALKTKSKQTCESEIKLCITDSKKCDSNYYNCETDEYFNNFFAVCAASASKCDEFISDLKKTFVGYRDSSIDAREKLITSTATAYQNARAKKLQDAQAICNNDAGLDKCIATVCTNNMENKCEIGFEYEKSMATRLCGFYTQACKTINKK